VPVNGVPPPWPFRRRAWAAHKAHTVLPEKGAIMRNAIVWIAVLTVLGCSRNPSSNEVGSTRTTGGQVGTTASAEQIRVEMLDQRPDAPGTVNAIDITNDNGVVTLRGAVDDEKMKSDLINRVKSIPGVQEVRDDLRIEPKATSVPPQPPTRRAPQPPSTK